MAKKKFYVVKKGRKPGIYLTWEETKRQVDGFAGAVYKSFSTRAEAENWNGEIGTNAKPTKTIENGSGTVLYTDGGSRNTGNIKGGHVRKADLAAWAFLVKKDSRELSGSGGEFGATNNRMEIMALINGLNAISEHYGEEEPVLVVSDSKYVLDAINQKWIWGWKRRGWKKADGTTVANQELWQQVAQILMKMKHLEFKWTKGHATNHGNVFVDELLNKTMDKMAQAGKIPAPQKVTPEVKKETPKPGTEESVKDLEDTFRQMGLF